MGARKSDWFDDKASSWLPDNIQSGVPAGWPPDIDMEAILPTMIIPTIYPPTPNQNNDPRDSKYDSK